MTTLDTDHDDFFDEAPTAVMIHRLIEEAIADAQLEVDGLLETEPLDDEDFDPAAFRAIGTR